MNFESLNHNSQNIVLKFSVFDGWQTINAFIKFENQKHEIAKAVLENEFDGGNTANIATLFMSS